MQAVPKKSSDSESLLQLLLFIDERPSSRKNIQQIRSYLDTLKKDYFFELKVVDVGERPDVAEHYKVVATPALIKIHPLPKQILAGTNLVAKLKDSWNRWQRSVEDYQGGFNGAPLQSANSSENSAQIDQSTKSSLATSVELIRLSEEIFRLKQEKDELLEQLQFKDQIMSMLAHDLRSPLTAASIAVESLDIEKQSKKNGGEAYELTPELKARLLYHARSQFIRMERMITDLLQAARGNSSEFKVRPSKLAVGKLCLDIIAQMHEQFQIKSQVVETDIPQDLPWAYADQELVSQVIINLLDNAIKYTPQGCQIKVSVLHRTAQKIQVSVCDDGPGIPAENREHIFEDRFRLKRDEAQEGYGLGLSLCQKIVRAHYGRIWVETAARKGCDFHFTLPVYR
ncbi:MAG: histidine kinase [Coleofasciculaceae cyanobacterium]